MKKFISCLNIVLIAYYILQHNYIGALVVFLVGVYFWTYKK